ncbi:MAG: SGNH/GDSL hydrolase family protein [Lentisphaeria bacterium]|nr:SGNH/GDSL hydrolase family protein [Lentisphaeria bacterium]
MKKLLCCAAAAAVLTAAADERIYTDNFTNSVWRVINTRQQAELKDRTLRLTDGRPYFRTVPRIFPWGAKIRFAIEKTDAGPYRIGFIFYPEEPGKKAPRLMSPELSGAGSFTAELPVRARSVGLIVQGQGVYRKAELVRLCDPAFRLEADPGYQLVSGEPAPFKFRLFRNDEEVPDAEIRRNGQDAVHPSSGATAHAFIDRGDPAPFDAVARAIKIDKPVSFLYLGDSLTFFDLGRNHADKVGYFLNKYNPGKVKIWNYACGGDSVSRVIQRLNGKGFKPGENRYRDLWARHYDWAVVFLGHNDTKASSANGYREVLVPPARQKELYLQLISELRKRGVKRIILFSPTSSNFAVCDAIAKKTKRVHNRFGEPAHLEAFDRVLRTLARENGVEYLDLYTDMKALPDKAALTRPQDGVHLTDRGHDYVALKTLKYLKDTQTFALKP